MPTEFTWESIRSEGARVADRISALVREGNVRHVIVEHRGRTLAEFPVNAGVVGAVLAPQLAALGAVVALFKDCTIRVQRAAEPADAQARVVDL